MIDKKKLCIDLAITYTFARGALEWGECIRPLFPAGLVKMRLNAMLAGLKGMDQLMNSELGPLRAMECETSADEFGEFLVKFHKTTPESRVKIMEAINSLELEYET
jgi:hypothetical protein